MPLFEYQCRACGKKFEELVSSSTAKTPCPSCGSADTAKLLSVFAASTGSSHSGEAPCSRPGCGSGFS